MVSRAERCTVLNSEIQVSWQKLWWDFINSRECNAPDVDKGLYISYNPNLSIHIVLKYKSIIKWNWQQVSSNPGITAEDILNHPELPWDDTYISSNPNIRIEHVKSWHFIEWNWNLLSKNPGIKIEDILENRHLPWVYYFVYRNPNLRWYHLEDLKKIRPYDKQYKYAICSNPGISLKYIEANIDEFNNFEYISYNPNLTLEFVVKNSKVGWTLYYLYSNPGIKLDELKVLNEIYADSSSNAGIVSNPNITLDFIKSWDGMAYYMWKLLSANPGITIEDIKNNPDLPWDWDYICKNPFTKSKQDFHIQHYRRHLAAFRIQQHWHRIREDPRHPVGRRRLEREYDLTIGAMATLPST